MNKIKRLLAIICIILLLGMYVITFVMSIVDDPNTMTIFRGCIALTIFIPVVAYIYICLHKLGMRLSKREGSVPYDPAASQDDSAPSDDAPQQQQ